MAGECSEYSTGTLCGWESVHQGCTAVPAQVVILQVREGRRKGGVEGGKALSVTDEDSG